jgi:ribulose 1,5-bisphosphate carboxylase large subunit-like protein
MNSPNVHLCIQQQRHADSKHHPERFWVDYIIKAATKEQAYQTATEICLEQTVELPGSTRVVHDVESYVVGHIERVVEVSHRRYRVSIAYPNDTAGDELTVSMALTFVEGFVCLRACIYF